MTSSVTFPTIFPRDCENRVDIGNITIINNNEETGEEEANDDQKRLSYEDIIRLANPGLFNNLFGINRGRLDPYIDHTPENEEAQVQETTYDDEEPTDETTNVPVNEVR